MKTQMMGIASAVAVFLADNAAQPAARTELLKSLFELTPAEARLAEQLASGPSLSDAADNLGITIGTARTQLKSVFLKTDTSRQAELVRLLLLLPGDR
jgi:DNA-binding CsgD family transcriptional regulator